MSFLTKSSCSLLQRRTFASTACALGKAHNHQVAEKSAVPDYPYPPSRWYKQSNLGLYGQQKIHFGNMVSERNKIKTRRYWRPNVHRKRLWSESLGSFIRMRITTRVLRTIDKCGGLDEYLLGEKAARVKDLGVAGWKLRWRIMQTEKVKERFRAEREAAGLPPREEASLDSDGQLASKEQIEHEIRKYDEELQRGPDLEMAEEVEEGEGEFMQEELAPAEKKVL
jgi:large subunit ribosomal protein L28